MIAGCGALGLRRSRELRVRVELLRQLLGAMERLRVIVALQGCPLPEAAASLAQTWPRLFAPFAAPRRTLRDAPYHEIWSEAVDAMGMGREETRALRELGGALTSGEEPERVFSLTAERLAYLLEEARREAAEKCRLSASLGLCAGCLLVILFF